MSFLIARWGRRGAIAFAVLLAAGFVVGTLVNDRPTASRSSGADEATGVQAFRTGESKGVAVAPGSATTTLGITAEPATGAPALGPGAGGSDVVGSVLPPIRERIVKNADLGVEVKAGAFESVWAKAFQIATRFGGYVASSNRGVPRPVPLAEGAPSIRRDDDDERRLFGDIAIRVPVTRFEAALEELRKVGKVTGDVVSSQDVTEEFVDLESRLRHLRAQEAVLLRLMGQAKTIQDTLVVQQQLSQIQLQIEEITGRLRALSSLTDLSTINVHLAEPGAVIPVDEEGPSFQRAWETALEGLVRMGTTAMIAATWLAPFMALAVLILAARRLRTRPAPTA